MLRFRVIPIVLLDGYSVVKTIQFNIRRNLGNPIVVSRIYNSRNVDELILLDIDASKDGREIDLHTVEAVARECFMPLTVGGGLKTIANIENTLKAGADKVSLNTVFLQQPEFLKTAVSHFGSQCIVASLDVKKDAVQGYELFSHAHVPIKWSLKEAIQLLIDSKVGEILVNSVDLDGMMTGFDGELIQMVSSMTNMPIIAAGGASSPEDCSRIIKQGACAVAAASIFHFTSITPRSCKEEMAKAGLPVRL